MTSTIQTETDDELTDRYIASLHALCAFVGRGRRRECSWAASGYCEACGRPRPSLLPDMPGTIS
jgi:hypothetical protein